MTPYPIYTISVIPPLVAAQDGRQLVEESTVRKAIAELEQR